MNYWKAKHYLGVIKQFEILVYEYWKKLPDQSRYGDFGRFHYQDNDETMKIREKISYQLPHVQEAAKALGVSYVFQSYPAPAVGGPVLPVNVFHSVIEPNMGHSTMDQKLIMHTMTTARSLAEKQTENELIHMLLPWNWIIDLCAFVIRLPFIILRRAGLPREVEDNIISQAIKIIALVLLVSFLTYKGISLAQIDILRLIK